MMRINDEMTMRRRYRGYSGERIQYTSLRKSKIYYQFEQSRPLHFPLVVHRFLILRFDFCPSGLSSSDPTRESILRMSPSLLNRSTNSPFI